MFGKPRSKRIVSVDWDARVMRVVHALVGGKRVSIDRLLTSHLGPDLDVADPKQVGDHLRRTLDQEGITTRQAIVDVPRDQVILKTLRLPTAQPEELPGMVEIQIAKELPFPVAEAAVDFTTEASSTDSETAGEVLVAAVRREVLDFYQEVFDAAGLKLERVGLRPYANKVAVTERGVHAVPERLLFIDVRPTFMEIDVVRASALAFSRSASVMIPPGGGEPGVVPLRPVAPDGGSDPETTWPAPEVVPGREGVIHSLVLEVTRSIEAYRAGDPGAEMDQAVIGGDVGVEEALAEAIQERLQIPAEIYNPASSFGWEPDEGAEAAGFAASLGLVLGHADEGRLHFDFLHPKKTVSVSQERLKKAPVVAAVVVLFVAAAAVGLGQVTKPSRLKLARIEKAIAGLEGKERDNRKFLDLVEQVKQFDQGQHVWIDVLYDVISLLPSNQDLVINYIEMNQKLGRLVIKTRTKKRDAAFAVVKKLEAFRREGHSKPRFRVSVGTQTEKKGEKYPYFQDLRVMIRDDGEPEGRSPAGGAGRD